MSARRNFYICFTKALILTGAQSLLFIYSALQSALNHCSRKEKQTAG